MNSPELITKFTKQTISSEDNANFTKDNINGLGLLRENPSIDELIRMYLTIPLVFKAINIRANKVIGKGFKLVLSKDDNITGAEEVLKKCNKFINKVGIDFFRQSIINAYVSGNEWTELIYNRLGHLVNLNHGDFKTIDFRRNFITNKVLLDGNGEPIAYWQYVKNIAELHYNI